MSGSKRPASRTTAAAEVPAQRMRLSAAGAVAADPPAAVRPPLSPAQRCATDTVTLAFEFFAFQELIGAARTCRAWLAAAVKVKPRSLCLTIEPADRMAAVCASSSPFKRHISRVVSGLSPWLSIEQLAQLSQLPQLTALEVQLNADDLIRLMDEQGGGALAELRAAFPPKLRELILCLSEAHSTAACQLQLDALSAMEGLEELVIVQAFDEEPYCPAPLSLDPPLIPSAALDPVGRPAALPSACTRLTASGQRLPLSLRDCTCTAARELAQRSAVRGRAALWRSGSAAERLDSGSRFRSILPPRGRRPHQQNDQPDNRGVSARADGQPCKCMKTSSCAGR